MRRKRRIEFESELNLVPMLDMFLSLIPFLLMSAVLMSVGGVHIETPKQTADNHVIDANTSIDLRVYIENGKVRVFGYRNKFESKIVEIDRDFNLSDRQGLRNYLLETQQKYKKIGSSLFHAARDTRYEDVVAILSIVRASEISNSLVMAVGAVQ